VGQARFEDLCRRVVLAGIDGAGVLGDAFRFFDAVEGEGRSQLDGRRHRAVMRRRVVAMVDGAGLGAEAAVGATHYGRCEAE
jgi:hypothetical protein